MKRNYETIVIYDMGLDEAALEQRIQKTESVIKANDGEITKLEKWGKKTLAYLIKKKRDGYYVFYAHTSEPTVVEALRNIYFFDESVLKNMTVVIEDIRKSRFTPKKAKAPKPVENPAPVAAEPEAAPEATKE